MIHFPKFLMRRDRITLLKCYDCGLILQASIAEAGTVREPFGLAFTLCERCIDRRNGGFSAKGPGQEGVG